MNRHRLCSTLLLLLLAGASALGGQSRAPANPFELEIRFDVWGKSVSDALHQIASQAKIDILVSPHFIAPEDLTKHKLYLRSDRIRVIQAVELLARSLGCRYRIDGPRSVYLTGGYDWLSQDQSPGMKTTVLIRSIENVIAEGGNVNELEALLQELVKVHTLFPEYSLRVETEDRKIVAVLPATLRQVLDAALRRMETQGKDYRVQQRPTLSDGELAMLESLRAKVVATYKDAPLKDVLGDLALQSGITIAFDAVPFRETSPPNVNLDLGLVSLKTAVEALAKELGMAGYEVMPPDAIFLTTEARKWSKAATQAFHWDDVAVEAYAIRPLANVYGGATVAHTIRMRVNPDIWLDPCTAVIYHPYSGNLIVVAPPAVHPQVILELQRLEKKAPHRR